IAEGAIGKVFRANDSGFARIVALKQMHDRSTDRLTEQLQATFLLEGEVTARLDHPGILPMYGLGRTKSGQPFYVMKFIDTPDFESLINKFHCTQSGNTTASTITAEQLRKLLSHFLAACQTLQYAHDRGVLHCDVKPANIMTGRYGETYVVDWGMAILFKVNTSHKNELQSGGGPIQPLLQNSRVALHRDQGGSRSFVSGTLGYMAPEHYQANRENSIKEMTPACDIFSMGAVLYQIITGVIPVNAVSDETASERVQRISKGEFLPASSITSGVHKSLAAICQKAMHPDRLLRYHRLSDLADDVEKWLAGEPVSARQESYMERVYRWSNRNRTGVFLGFGGLILILLTSMVILFIEQKNRVQMEETDFELVYEQELALKNERNAIAQRKRVVEREALRIKSEKLLVATINRFIEDVSNNPDLKNNPDLEDLRNDLLKAPMEYLSQFETELNDIPDTSPESMALVANGFAQLGALTSRIGKKAEALMAFEKSIATFEKVLKLQPDNRDFQVELARSLKRTAETHQLMGNYKLAEPIIDRAYSIINNLLKNDINNFIYLNEQADIQDDMGVIYRATERADKARELFQQAIETREKLVLLEPDNETFKLDLASSYRILGISQQDIGKNEEARKSYYKYL
ncbi:MAG: protein kinase domain-containing protein, partial [bacterium]